MNGAIRGVLLLDEEGRLRFCHLNFPCGKPTLQSLNELLMVPRNVPAFTNIVLQIEKQIRIRIADILPLAITDCFFFSPHAVDPPEKSSRDFLFLPN